MRGANQTQMFVVVVLLFLHLLLPLNGIDSSGNQNLLRAQQFPVPDTIPSDSLPIIASNVDDIGAIHLFRSDAGPNSLEIISRTEDSVKLKWTPTPGTHPIMYNLLMDRVSVYSGPKTYFEETGLQPERCYTFQVAAYIDGRWTKFSPALRVASMQHSVDVEHIDQGVKAIRSNIKKAAQARISGAPCLLDGINDPSNVNGGPGYVEYIGSTGDFSVAGVDASVLNCQVSKCLDASSKALTIVNPLIGHLLVRLDDSSWTLRFIEIPPETNILEYNNPKNAFMKVTLNLLGCRANELSPNSQLAIGKTGEAASKCLELNCTAEFKQYYFCVPPGAAATSTTKSGDSLSDINTWIHGINRATMPRHTFQRYEVNLKANVAPLISDNPLKELDKTVYSPTGYREPFFSSWLTRLVKIDASPHFAQLLGTFRCSKLPDKFDTKPDKVLGGILPPYRTGGPVASNVAKMKIDGDTFESLWMIMIQETFTTDLQTILDGYKGYALDNEWVRGVVFQLIQGIGVGYHTYGLHHNDLLTMSNIRFRQIPKKTVASKKYWCYDFNDIAISGDGCGQSATDDDNNAACSNATSSPASTPGTEIAETSMLQMAVLSNGPDMTSPTKDANGGVFTCTNGVDENNELPADGLPSAECAALNHPGSQTKDNKDGDGDDNMSKFGGYKKGGLRFQEAAQKVEKKKLFKDDGNDTNNSKNNVEEKKEESTQRKSWCIEADKVDGLQVKIYNYGAASLAKKAIQWWKKGYTFPNTPWYDDLQSVAVILCGYMAQHVNNFDVEGRKLCTRMRQGYYRENPLHALTHKYFESLLAKDEIVMEQRNNYIYKPQMDCSCKENKKQGKKQRMPTKPCPTPPPSAKSEDGVNEGQVVMALMFDGKQGGNGRGKDTRAKQGDPVPPLDTDAVAITDTLDPPSAHSPMTPWIAQQSTDPKKGMSVSVKWQSFKAATLYNFMLDGVSVYTGKNTGVTLDGLKDTKCYRLQVAAFGNTGWSPVSHALHVNDCGLRVVS